MRLRNGYLGPLFLIAWSCAAFIAVWLSRMRATDTSLALTAAGLLLASLAVSRYILGLSFTSAPVLYLSLLGLFHLGAVVPWALGIYDISRVTVLVPYGLSRALALVIYSIVTYQLGLLAGLQRLRYRGSTGFRDSELEDIGIFAAGALLFLVGVIMFVIGLVRLDPVGYYRLTYSEIWRLRAESDPRFFGSGITFVLIGSCMTAAGASKKYLRTTLVAASLWILTLFYLGFRGPAIVAGLIVYAVALKKGFRSPQWVMWLAAALLLVAVPLVRVAREVPLGQRSWSPLNHDFNILDGPAEAGASIRPLVETLDMIDSTNYRYGKTYLQAMKVIVPNIALHWEAPSTGSIDDLRPSYWITAAADPWAYRNYGGIGFSGIAEPYMNFGTIGVVAYFFSLAFALMRLEKLSIRSSYALASWALLLGPLLWTSRNDFAEFCRPAVWGLLYLGVVRLFSGSYSLISRTRQQSSFQVNPKASEEGLV